VRDQDPTADLRAELVAAWRHEDFLKPWNYPEIIE
jgi:hypothetical protein